MASAMLNSNGMSAHLGVVQFKEELRRLKREAIEDLSTKMEDLIGKTDLSSTLDVLEKFQSNSRVTAKNRRKKGELPDKEFHPQNSVLTDLFQSKHIQTIENMTIAAGLLWILISCATDALDKRSFNAFVPNSDLLEHSFSNYHIALTFWLGMMAFTLLIYPLCYFWNCHRPSGPKGLYDYCFFSVYIIVLLHFLWLPTDILFFNPLLGPAAALAIAIEQLRLIMKMHSFVREMTKRVFRAEEYSAKRDDDDSSVPVKYPPFPGFSRYLYFLFAPTLIYRDEYPRKENTDWNYVCSNFFQFFASIVFMYYLVQRYLRPEFARYETEEISMEQMLRATFRCTIPGAAILLLVFFSFLHSWLNAWAEMLRFADRLFYKDWWNTHSYSGFYRTWNCVVHDWLYVYVYKDVIETYKLRKPFAAMIVFAMSACFHEYVIASSLRFFYPVMLMEFGILGFVFFFINMKGRLSNVFVWLTLIYGMGVMVSLYSLEITARTHCPRTLDFFLDVFVPRSWTCALWDNKFHFNATL